MSRLTRRLDEQRKIAPEEVLQQPGGGQDHRDPRRQQRDGLLGGIAGHRVESPDSRAHNTRRRHRDLRPEVLGNRSGHRAVPLTEARRRDEKVEFEGQAKQICSVGWRKSI